MQERRVESLSGGVALVVSLGLIAVAVAVPATLLSRDVMQHAAQHGLEDDDVLA